MTFPKNMTFPIMATLISRGNFTKNDKNLDVTKINRNKQSKKSSDSFICLFSGEEREIFSSAYQNYANCYTISQRQQKILISAKFLTLNLKRHGLQY